MCHSPLETSFLSSDLPLITMFILSFIPNSFLLRIELRKNCFLKENVRAASIRFLQSLISSLKRPSAVSNSLTKNGIVNLGIHHFQLFNMCFNQIIFLVFPIPITLFVMLVNKEKVINYHFLLPTVSFFLFLNLFSQMFGDLPIHRLGGSNTMLVSSMTSVNLHGYIC